MSDDTPRFEFRTWGRPVDGAAQRIRSLAPCEGTRESRDLYFVSRVTAAANPKARADVLDVKVLEDEVGGFEQWEVRFKEEFPVAAETLRTGFYPLLEVEPPRLERSEYSLERLRREGVEAHDELAAVEITKCRRFYTIAGCRTELTEAVIGGRPMRTVAVESADPAAVLEACRELGLGDEENVSYPRAIRRVLGWEAPIEARRW